MEQVKPFWQSKTFWTNFAMFIASQIPPLGDKMSPELMAGAFAIVNMVLRFISKDKITIR